MAHLMRVFKALCNANDIDTIIATATSAVRDARNRAEFLQRVEKEAGSRPTSSESACPSAV